jgi:hypothetical protein
VLTAVFDWQIPWGRVCLSQLCSTAAADVGTDMGLQQHSHC